MIPDIANLARDAVKTGQYGYFNDYLEEHNVKSPYVRSSGLLIGTTAVKTVAETVIIDVFTKDRWDLLHVFQVIANNDADKHEVPLSLYKEEPSNA